MNYYKAYIPDNDVPETFASSAFYTNFNFSRSRVLPGCSASRGLIALRLSNLDTAHMCDTELELVGH